MSPRLKRGMHNQFLMHKSSLRRLRRRKHRRGRRPEQVSHPEPTARMLEVDQHG
jgi:hypothetical protein